VSEPSTGAEERIPASEITWSPRMCPRCQHLVDDDYRGNRCPRCNPADDVPELRRIEVAPVENRHLYHHFRSCYRRLQERIADA
jgi:hypothetical protein